MSKPPYNVVFILTAREAVFTICEFPTAIVPTAHVSDASRLRGHPGPLQTCWCPTETIEFLVRLVVEEVAAWTTS